MGTFLLIMPKAGIVSSAYCTLPVERIDSNEKFEHVASLAMYDRLHHGHDTLLMASSTCVQLG